MATYEEIYGKRVDVLSSDPTLNSASEGQVWYNSSTGALKTVVSFGAWYASTPQIVGGYSQGAAGTAVAALLKKKIDLKNQRVGVVICGGNIGIETIREVLN